MFTILLEVKSSHDHRRTNNFYNPASEGFKRFPRTEKGISKAMDVILSLVTKTEWIEDYRFVFFKGKYHYSKSEMKPLFIISSKGEQISP